MSIRHHYSAFDFRLQLQFRPKLSLDIRPKVRLQVRCLWFWPQFRLQPKLAKSVSVGL